MNYQVIIHDAEEGGYWAEATGMPGRYSQGETLAETKANIQEAAMAWMESQVAMAILDFRCVSNRQRKGNSA